jgi:hypothetical protein
MMMITSVMLFSVAVEMSYSYVSPRSPSQHSDIESVLFDTSIWTPDQAEQWLAYHKHQPIKAEVSHNFFPIGIDYGIRTALIVSVRLSSVMVSTSVGQSVSTVHKCIIPLIALLPAVWTWLHVAVENTSDRYGLSLTDIRDTVMGSRVTVGQSDKIVIDGVAGIDDHNGVRRRGPSLQL